MFVKEAPERLPRIEPITWQYNLISGSMELYYGMCVAECIFSITFSFSFVFRRKSCCCQALTYLSDLFGAICLCPVGVLGLVLLSVIVVILAPFLCCLVCCECIIDCCKRSKCKFIRNIYWLLNDSWDGCKKRHTHKKPTVCVISSGVSVANARAESNYELQEVMVHDKEVRLVPMYQWAQLTCTGEAGDQTTEFTSVTHL